MSPFSPGTTISAIIVAFKTLVFPPSAASASFPPETAAHLYANCPCFSTLQFDLNGLFSIPSLPPSWTVDRVVSFLQHASISTAMDNPHTLPFVIEHDWSDVDPDPPDSDSTDSPVALSDSDSAF